MKTAELFRVSCQLGASLAGRADGYVSAAARFGRHLGIAYQIYDDLADFFGEEGRIGKTLGTDLASGKLTLPLIVLMERLPADAARELAGEQQARAFAARQDADFRVDEAGVEEEILEIGLDVFAHAPNVDPVTPLGKDLAHGGAGFEDLALLVDHHP